LIERQTAECAVSMLRLQFRTHVETGKQCSFDHCLFQILDRNRTTDQIALGQIAPVSPQEIQLILGLHTLCDNLNSEVMGKIDHSASNHRVIMALSDISDERSVNLQHVDREIAQVPERRVAHAKIIDRQMGSQLVQLGKLVAVVLDVLDENLLRKFELQLTGVDILAGQGVAHVVDEGNVVQFPARQIDRNAQVVTGRTLPAGKLAAGGEHHPPADLGNPTAFFRQRNELNRWQQTAAGMLPSDKRWMLPSDKRFNAVDLTGVEVQLRLVVKCKFVIGQGLVKVFVQLKAHHFPVLHTLGIELIGIAALFLGPVESHIGIAQQGVSVMATLRVHRYAHSGSDTVFFTLDAEWFGKTLLDLSQQVDDV